MTLLKITLKIRTLKQQSIKRKRRVKQKKLLLLAWVTYLPRHNSMQWGLMANQMSMMRRL